MQNLAGNFVPSTTPCKAQGGLEKRRGSDPPCDPCPSIYITKQVGDFYSLQATSSEKDAAQIPTSTRLRGEKLSNSWLLLGPVSTFCYQDPTKVCAIRGIEDPSQLEAPRHKRFSCIQDLAPKIVLGSGVELCWMKSEEQTWSKQVGKISVGGDGTRFVALFEWDAIPKKPQH